MHEIDYTRIASNFLSDLFKDAYKTSWDWAKAQDKKNDYFGSRAKIYGKKVFDRYDYIRVFGMSDKIPLTELYVRVNILEKITERWNIDYETLIKKLDRNIRSFGSLQNTPPQTGIQAINSHQKFILLGKPGAGKTTYLRYLALQSVHKDSNIKNRKLPIFITLRKFVDFEGKLIDYITEQFEICNLEDAQPFIENLLKKGKCLILLDGLDEVPQSHQDNIINQINDFSDKYSDNQFVISCRIHAYNAAFPHFKDLELADFNDEQKQHFIDRWFKKEKKVGEKMWKSLKDQTQLLELAATPVLLTLMCIDYDKNFDLQTNRASLYKSAIEALLIQWDAHRRIKRDEIYKNLSTDRKMQLFSLIAANTFEKDQIFIPSKTLIQYIANFLTKLSNIPINNLQTDSKAVLKAIVAQHGIFTPRAKDIYSYLHLTFQEYFTAQYILDNRDEGTLEALIQNHATNPNWREVFLITVASLPNTDRFFKILVTHIDQIAQNNISIQKLLRGLIEITSPVSDISLHIRRSYGLFLITNNAIASKSDHNLTYLTDLARSFASDLDVDHAIDRARTRIFDLDRIRTIAIDIDRNSTNELIQYLQVNKLLVECLNQNIVISPNLKQNLIIDILSLYPNITPLTQQVHK